MEVESAKRLLGESLAALKDGNATTSLAAANRALTALASPEARDRPSSAALLARAFHRKAAALGALGDSVEAVRVYRSGLAACGGAAPALAAALRLTLENLPASWHAAYWCGRIEAGQGPAPFSSRDGRRLAGIPPDARLAPGELRAALERVLATRRDVADEAADLLCQTWSRGRKQPGRAELSYLRGAAYLEAGDAGQALRDARCAIVFGPRAGPAAEERTPEADAGDAGEEGWGAASPWLTAARSSLWPAALGLLGAAYEATGDNVRALLLACLAAEGAGGHEREGSDEGAGGACPEVPAVGGSSAGRAVCGGPEEGQDGGGLESGQQEESVHEAARRRLLRRVPEECVAAVRARGSAGLLALLSAAHTQAKPEVLRRRPKYYYYYEWMKKRILEQYPALPEPVMDKLLTLDANELDLVLQYPQATRQMVDNLLGVLETRGCAALETYRVPLLSWEEVKALKGPGTVGLALGSSADAPPTPPKLHGRAAAQPLAVEAGEGGAALASEMPGDEWSPPAVGTGAPFFEELD
ncbi:hypothetical protein ACKKBF_B14315 [Auxenochlorella protothecoides x Auxenochlorella symbiontica]